MSYAVFFYCLFRFVSDLCEIISLVQIVARFEWECEHVDLVYEIGYGIFLFCGLLERCWIIGREGILEVIRFGIAFYVSCV